MSLHWKQVRVTLKKHCLSMVDISRFHDYRREFAFNLLYYLEIERKDRQQ